MTVIKMFRFLSENCGEPGRGNFFTPVKTVDPIFLLFDIGQLGITVSGDERY